MPEVVSGANAHDRVAGMPCGKPIGSQAVPAAVVRHLEDVGPQHATKLEHAALRGLLGISCQDAREATAPHSEDDTRVVGLERL